MDIVTLALAKSFALKVSAGYSSVVVDEATSSIIFTLNDGSKATLKIPRLKEVKDVIIEEIEDTSHLIFEMSDGSKIDAGILPEQKIQLSQKEDNVLEKKDDGYYVPASSVKINPSESNALKSTTEGLFVPDLNSEESKQNILEIIKDNLETEDIDFSNF